ncbi:MAG: YitT family protein, partial [Clostridiales bacterium]|nr:YitT family protein [Clostridiales bacterium]
MPQRLITKYKDYLFILIGTALVAISLASFFEPNGLVTGGVTGLAIIVEDLGNKFYGISIPLWLTNLVLNIPLFLLALKIKGKRFLLRTFVATVSLSIFLSWAEGLPKLSSNTDLTIYTVFGSVIQGIGMGLIFRSKTTTGGTDLLASVVHNYIRHISIAKILFVVDGCIMAVGFFVFGARSTMYAVIAAYIVSKITDVILEGFDFAKAAFIISDK